MMTALHYCHLRHHHHGHHDHDCCRHHHHGRDDQHQQRCQKHPPPQQDHHQHRSLIIHRQHSNCIQATHRIVVPGICIAPSSGIICNVCNTYYASHRHLYKHTRYNWYKLLLVSLSSWSSVIISRIIVLCKQKANIVIDTDHHHQ